MYWYSAFYNIDNFKTVRVVAYNLKPIKTRLQKQRGKIRIIILKNYCVQVFYCKMRAHPKLSDEVMRNIPLTAEVRDGNDGLIGYFFELQDLKKDIPWCGWRQNV